MNKNWEFRDYNEIIAQTISKQMGISIIMARLLTQRGILGVDEVRKFLYADISDLSSPFSLTGMQVAVDRIKNAIELNEKTVVYGDYDVDGICSIVILKECLDAIGCNVDYYVPDRFSEGYGLNKNAVEFLASQGCRLLITVDCGISSIEEIVLANQLDMDVIITDHHTPGPVQPPALAVINPKNDDNKAAANLAGVGVAYKLACALGIHNIPENERYNWLELVALATVADIVPLTGENRILVKYGLEVLEKTRRPGLRALLNETQLQGKEMKSWHIGFVLAPRLNSAGRLKTARTSIDLLLSQDTQEAEVMAKLLCQLNDERRLVEEGIYKEALIQIENDINLEEESVLIVAGDGWHEGVVGIVASRLADNFNRPAIVISWEGDIGKGSARSYKDFDIHAALSYCSTCLIRFGGHKMAAGLSIAKEQLTIFNDLLKKYVEDNHISIFQQKYIRVDMEIGEENISQQLIDEIRLLNPFGEGNPVPSFILRGTEINSPVLVGVSKDHLKLKAGTNNIEAIAFNKADLINSMNKTKQDLLFEMEENNFRGKKTVQLKIRDIKPSFIPDQSNGISTNNQKLIGAIGRTICELNSHRPVIIIYPGHRSLIKHLDIITYFFNQTDIQLMHGLLNSQERRAAQNKFQQGYPMVYLSTRSFIEYYTRKNQIPDNLQYAIQFWPQDLMAVESFFPDCEIESINRDEKMFYYRDEDWKFSYEKRSLVYANRQNTVSSLSHSYSELDIEAGVKDMQQRRAARQKFLSRSSGVLVGDGTHTAGWPYLGKIDHMILADSPFGHYELAAFTDYLNITGDIRTGVFFTKQALEKNQSFLNKLYPDIELLESVRPFLLNKGNVLLKEDIGRLASQLSKFTKQEISSDILWPVLRIMADLGLCQLKKSGNIIEIKLDNTDNLSLNIYDSAYFLEGMAEKNIFAEWERDLNKFMVW